MQRISPFVLLFLSLALITQSPANAKPLPLSPDDARMLSNQKVAYVIHDKPSFLAMTPAKASFAMLGALAGISAGNQLVKDNDIADPADSVGRALQEELISKFGAVVLEHVPTVVKNSKIDGMITLYPDANYLVDVETSVWSLQYFPLAWGTYNVRYIAKVNVVDLKNKQIIASDKCNVSIGDSKTGPSYDELTKDGAALLKQNLATLSENCVAALKVSLLGESPALNTSTPVEQNGEKSSTPPANATMPDEDRKAPAKPSQAPEPKPTAPSGN
jgi:hypothetical protein